MAQTISPATVTVQQMVVDAANQLRQQVHGKLIRFILFLLAWPLWAAVTVTGPTTCQQNTTCTYVASGGTGPYTYSLASGSVGSINSTTGVYTAPSSITPSQTINGCQVHPNNSVYNTRIDGLPVHASSAVWVANMDPNSVSLERAFFRNVGLSGDSTTSMSFVYTPAQNGPFHLANVGNNFRQRIESGSFSWNVAGEDHHWTWTAKDTCGQEEIYGPTTAGFWNDNPSPGNGRSGVTYALNSLGIAPAGTDAGQLELTPLSFRASEILGGTINHAARVTLDVASIATALNLWPAQANNGSPSTCQATFTVNTSGTTVTFVSATSGAGGFLIWPNGMTATINGQVGTVSSVTATTLTFSVNLGTHSSVSMTQSNVNCAPYGARLRLKSSFSPPPFDGNCTTTGCHTAYKGLITMLKNYGILIADIGSEGGMSMFIDQYNADLASAMTELVTLGGGVQLGSTANIFEIVDESSLQTNQAQTGTSGTWGEAKWNNSAGITPSGYAVVIATDSLAATGDFSISLQAVAVGVQRPVETIQAGSGTLQLVGWATGSATTTVTWTLGTCAGGSITSGGLFTVPATVSGREECTATATSVADGAKSATVTLVILPATGGILRIDAGALSDYTDSSSNVWFADMLSGHPALFDNAFSTTVGITWSNTGTVGNGLFNTLSSNNVADLYYHLTVPNGTYSVVLYNGNITTATNVMQWEIDAQGSTVIATSDPFTLSGNTVNAAFTQTFSAVVTNGSLDFVMRNIGVLPTIPGSTTAPLYTNPSSEGVNPFLAGFTVQQTAGPVPSTLYSGVVVSSGTVITH